MIISQLESLLKGFPFDAIVGGIDMEYDKEKQVVSYRLTAYKNDKILQQKTMEPLDLFDELGQIANCSKTAIRKIIDLKTKNHE